MNKETIRFALRKVLKDLRQAFDVHGVYVPRFSDAQPCRWSTRRRGVQFIPFQVMIDVAEFSLDYAMVRMPDGRILRQTQGIPMGDPISPGMPIAACAWMENEWMQSIAMEDKCYFRIRFKTVYGRHLIIICGLPTMGRGKVCGGHTEVGVLSSPPTAGGRERWYIPGDEICDRHATQRVHFPTEKRQRRWAG